MLVASVTSAKREREYMKALLASAVFATGIALASLGVNAAPLGKSAEALRAAASEPNAMTEEVRHRRWHHRGHHHNRRWHHRRCKYIGPIKVCKR